MFFLRSNKVYCDFGFLGVDMHNHVLPGLDDGAHAISDSLGLQQSLKELGFTEIIPTPHTMHPLYPNNKDTIIGSFNSVSAQVAEDYCRYPKIIQCSSEYLLDQNFPVYRQSKDLLDFANGHVLIEMSYAAPSPILEEEIYQLQMAGYTPVLAHPERYNYLHKNYDYFEHLVRRGCQLQLNLISLTGYYGKLTQKTALKLLDMNLYSWAGTDVHHERHIVQLRNLMSMSYMNLLCDYPFYNKQLREYSR